MTWALIEETAKGGRRSFSGAEEVTQQFAKVGDVYGLLDFKVKNTLAQGGTVVCFCEEVLLHRATGERRRHALVQRWTVVDDRIAALDEYSIHVATLTA